MIIGAPVQDRRVATVFDFADTLMVFDATEGEARQTAVVPLIDSLPSVRAGRIRNLGIDTLICGAVSNPLAAMIRHLGVVLVPGVTGDASEVVRAYLNGELNSGARFMLPGLRLSPRRGGGAAMQRRRCRGPRRGGRW